MVSVKTSKVKYCKRDEMGQQEFSGVGKRQAELSGSENIQVETEF